MAQRQGQTSLIIFFKPVKRLPSISQPTISLQQLSNLVPKQGNIVHTIAPFKAAHFPPFPLSKLQKFQAQVALLLINDTKSLRKSMIVLISSEQYLRVINLGCALSNEFTKQWMPVLKYSCRMSAQRYSQKCSLSLLSIILYMRQCLYYITCILKRHDNQIKQLLSQNNHYLQSVHIFSLNTRHDLQQQQDILGENRIMSITIF